MLYVKCVLVGLAAVIAAFGLSLVGISAFLAYQAHHLNDGEGIGWDPVSFMNLRTWLVVSGIFLAGAVLEYLHATKRA